MKHLVIVAAFLAVFLFLAHLYVSPAPFSYDEADYMYAASRGFIANYLDHPSLSFPEYLRVGLGRGRDPSQKSALSQSVRRTGDIFFYRHNHGPVYFYWLRALSLWTHRESWIRSLSPVFPLVTALFIYFGCLRILPAPQGSLAGILACAAFLFSPAVFPTTELAPHAMFVLWYIAALLLLAKLLETGERVFWYAAIAVTALAFCTLEVTFVLIAVVLACGHLERRRLAMDWRMALRSAALFAGIVIALYPAMLTHLAFAKAYLYYAYLAVYRKGAWGNVTFLETWTHRFSNSPVEWLLLGIAVWIWARNRALPGWRQALPFLLFGALMLATMLRVFTTGGRYMLPFLPALHVFAAIVLSGWLMRWRPAARVAALVVISGALLLNAARFIGAHPFQPDSRPSLLVAGIRQRNLGASRLLVPHDDLPTLHYYFPDADLTVYTDPLSIPGGRYDAIIGTADPVRIDPLTK